MSSQRVRHSFFRYHFPSNCLKFGRLIVDKQLENLNPSNVWLGIHKRRLGGDFVHIFDLHLMNTFNYQVRLSLKKKMAYLCQVLFSLHVFQYLKSIHFKVAWMDSPYNTPFTLSIKLIIQHSCFCICYVNNAPIFTMFASYYFIDEALLIISFLVVLDIE